MMTQEVGADQMKMSQLAMQIFKEEGIKGLYKGAMIRMGYLCAGGFAFFGMYE